MKPKSHTQVPAPRLVRILARLTGGPARQACLLHEKLAPSFDTWLITGGMLTGEHDMSYLLASDHNVVRLQEMSREISVWSDLRALWKIFRLLQRERPDVVHTHTAKAGALGRLAAWFAGVPVIVHTYHGHVFQGYFSRAKTRAYLAIERVLGRITTRVVAISKSQREELCTRYRVAPPEKVTVIQNGFELTRFSSIDREEARRELGIGGQEFVLVWAGRMAPVKDVQLLGQVIRRAAASSSKLLFLVVGDGEQKPELELLTQGLESVRLLGWHRDMERIWCAADAAILTSVNEGTPTSLIEAMAARLPFVATNVGAVRDLAVEPLSALDRGMGYLAANGYLTARTSEALLHCIEELAGNRDRAKQMGRSGYAFVMERFSYDRLIQEMSLLYQELILQQPQIGYVTNESKTISGATALASSPKREKRPVSGARGA